jgi:hypothetical protein
MSRLIDLGDGYTLEHDRTAVFYKNEHLAEIRATPNGFVGHALLAGDIDFQSRTLSTPSAVARTIKAANEAALIIWARNTRDTRTGNPAPPQRRVAGPPRPAPTTDTTSGRGGLTPPEDGTPRLSPGVHPE